MKPLTGKRIKIILQQELGQSKKNPWAAPLVLNSMLADGLSFSLIQENISDLLGSKEFERILDAISQIANNERRAADYAISIIRFLHALRTFRPFLLTMHPADYFAADIAPADEKNIRHTQRLFVELQVALPPSLHRSLQALRVRALRLLAQSAVRVALINDLDPRFLGKRGAAKSIRSAWRGLLVRELRKRVPVETEMGSATIAGLLRIVGDKEISHRNVASILKEER